jgi:putative ABC transport system substrate-binding protein
MKRRAFITLLGGAAVVWPRTARAQQPAMPVIGFLNSGSPDAFEHRVAAFRQGLRQAGYLEGRNVAIEFRWAENHNDRLATQAADLVARHVTVLVANSIAVQAAKGATATIPIVFVTGADPVQLGLVPSLNRPAGNVTGVYQLSNALGAKRVELLCELVPNASTIAMLTNPTYPNAEVETKDAQEAARVLGRQVHVLNASTETDFDRAFASLIQQGASALLVAADPFFSSRRDKLVALAARHAIPAIYEFREFATAGGLMSYGPSITDAYRLIGMYAGRVLSGDKPTNLPVMQSTKVELVINLKAARMLALTFPMTLLGRADEVIE